MPLQKQINKIKLMIEPKKDEKIITRIITEQSKFYIGGNQLFSTYKFNIPIVFWVCPTITRLWDGSKGRDSRISLRPSLRSSAHGRRRRAPASEDPWPHSGSSRSAQSPGLRLGSNRGAVNQRQSIRSISNTQKALFMLFLKKCRPILVNCFSSYC